MFTQLTVKNFAIAESIELNPGRGMVALTGETGAGKSIALDALGLALGDRADAGVVRHGADRAEISAVFDISRLGETRQWLKEHDLDQGDECILRRVVTPEGRSRAYINGQPCTLQDLRDLGEQLIDIHSQHQHQSLLRKDTHARMVDAFGGLGALAAAVRAAWQHWAEGSARLIALQSGEEERSARLELLRYQVQELDALALQADEIDQLEAEQHQLANAESLLRQSHDAGACLDDDEGGAIARVQSALSRLESADTPASAMSDAIKMLSEAQILLGEAADSLRHYIDTFDANPARQQEVEQRLSDIYQLARKHRVAPDELITLWQRLSTERDSLEADCIDPETLAAEVEQRRTQWQVAAEQLSADRQKAAAALEEGTASELAALHMPSVNFQIALQTLSDPHTPKANGLEDIEFLVSTNPGQAPKPLAKVASGGELSRLSLAIQVVAARHSMIPTLVFDEVDVGIGGATAEVVGRLLRRLGDKGQVICVTHLPQVAAQAHHHIKVEKTVLDQRTFSRLVPLAGEERVNEVARMLGGVEITAQSLAHAREMVDGRQIAA